MRAPRVSASHAALADPMNAVWRSAPHETIKMEGTPLGSVPSKFIKATITPEQVGSVRRIEVRALHNGEEVVFHLQWEDPSEDRAMSLDGTVFPDGCGIAFPLRGDAPLPDMGSKKQPINAWQWRADLDQPRAITAAGLGTSQPVQEPRLFANAVYSDGTWSVCLGRAIAVPEAPDEAIALALETPVKVGFAVWAGHKQERGPLKSFSGQWRQLTLEP